jgi:MSHA pilin protein MshC
MRLSAEIVEANKQKAEYVFGVSGEVRLSDLRAKHQRGFTLVELITIMVIVGIMAAVAIPRYFSRNTFDSRAFHDQVISTLRYAQKAAIAQHRFVCVTFTTTSVSLSHGTTVACSSGGLTSPTGVTPYTVTATAAGVTLSGYANFSFNRLGSPTPPQPGIFVSGYSPPIVVEPETGYVH